MTTQERVDSVVCSDEIDVTAPHDVRSGPRGAGMQVTSLLVATSKIEPFGVADLPVWRPTGQSYQNLAAFAAALTASAAVVLAVTDSPILVVTTLLIALLAGVLLAFAISRQRVRTALSGAVAKDFGNWPGTDEERRDLRRRGWHRCRRSVVMALVVGSAAGFSSMLAVVCLAAGSVGLVGALAIVSWITRYERENDVTVMSPATSPRGRMGALLFVTASGRF